MCPVADSSPGPCEDETGQQNRLKCHIVIRTDCSLYGCLLAVRGRELTEYGISVTFRNFIICPHSVLCVLCGSENKQRSLPYRVLISSVVPCGRSTFVSDRSEKFKYYLHEYCVFRGLTKCFLTILYYDNKFN